MHRYTTTHKSPLDSGHIYAKLISDLCYIIYLCVYKQVSLWWSKRVGNNTHYIELPSEFQFVYRMKIK